MHSHVRPAPGRLYWVWVHDVWIDDMTRRFGVMDGLGEHGRGASTRDNRQCKVL